MKRIHYIWANDGDLVTVVTNPQPSVSDPAHLIKTVVSAFTVHDEGALGASIIPSRMTPQKYGEVAYSEEELRQVHDKSVQAVRG